MKRSYCLLAFVLLLVGCATALKTSRRPANWHGPTSGDGAAALVAPFKLTATVIPPPLPPIPAAPAAKFRAAPPPTNYSVALAWDYTLPTTNAAIGGFKIYDGIASRTYTSIVDVPGGTNRQATVTNLVQGVTYYFAATAYDTNNLESDYSGEISFRLLPPGTNVLYTILHYTATNVTGPWTLATNIPPACLTNPPGNNLFFRLGIARTNF